MDRKEFEAFIKDNQALVANSEQLMKKIDELENNNRQLREELNSTRAKLESLEVTAAGSSRQADDAIKSARETVARIIRETDKRLSA